MIREMEMESADCTLAVPMTAKEKCLLESLSKQSKLDSGELVRMLLFETGILSAADKVQRKS